MTGHMMGATGAVECIATAMTLSTGILPPSVNLENPDERIHLNFAPPQATAVSFDHAISNSFGFGGQNASLVLTRYR
jgi:3-oxoacyl-[acyl-carrier-protein] synthase II